MTYTLRPWLIRVEQRLSRLLTDGQYVKFSVEGLLRGDTQSRYASYAVARQWGWMSANDILRLEDRPLIDGGDVYLTPLNMQQLGADDPAGEDPTVPVTDADAELARAAAEVSQKVYLAVTADVLTRPEGRALIRRAGAEIIDDETPEVNNA